MAKEQGETKYDVPGEGKKDREKDDGAFKNGRGACGKRHCCNRSVWQLITIIDQFYRKLG
jgi:hypothetical protein